MLFFLITNDIQEKHDDTKEAISIRKPKKNMQCNGQAKSTKGQTMIHKTLLVPRRLKVEQHYSHYRTGMQSGAPEGHGLPTQILA